MDTPKEIILEKLKFRLERRMSRDILDDMDIELNLDVFADQIVFQMTRYFWSDKSPEVIIEYPLNWWQAFKQRWFSQWMLKRWPVTLKVHHLNALTIYPDLKISLPKERYFFRIEQWENEAEASPMRRPRAHPPKQMGDN